MGKKVGRSLLLLEAIKQIRAAERETVRCREQVQQQGKELVRAAQQEGEEKLDALRAALRQEQEERRKELEKALEEEEKQLHAETERECKKLEEMGRAHMVEAVRRIAREVADGWQS